VSVAAVRCEVREAACEVPEASKSAPLHEGRQSAEATPERTTRVTRPPASDCEESPAPGGGTESDKEVPQSRVVKPVQGPRRGHGVAGQGGWLTLAAARQSAAFGRGLRSIAGS
jgi:hypothetical protein